MIEMPSFINGGNHVDERGNISFINSLTFDQVKRFYVIEHFNTQSVRAWQGHKIEQKWFYVTAGSFRVLVVKPDNWEKPSDHQEIMEFNLSDHRTGVLHVPGGYATGFKAQLPNSKIMAFSDFTMEESAKDNYRFNEELWYDWNKI